MHSLHIKNCLILSTVGKLVSPIRGRTGTDSISDFDPEDNNLKEHIKGMEEYWKMLYHRTFCKCFKIILARSDQGGIENTKNE